ncbi:non-homologous end-joining DNA ligase [Desertibacillus haloalkaliphilus]|uniref:non-homologous end-joining DNA ligase n=1 Tax=Desertibacillus haloalkaliphilus TaxID=1328930 RepID=UPI001FE79186|nr:non-homologous end-joining DNA ligase [Desertibacillus haloalkaliphilus]
MGKFTKAHSELMVAGKKLSISNPEKLLWRRLGIKKIDYLHYLSEVAPFMLPFLNERLLTVIRFPNGIHKESFYQKNCPDYAPTFIKTVTHEGIDYLLCNDIATLLWLGNQAAIEYHIPFQPYHARHPSEIVFDLDPPSQNEFSLAVEAALQLKQICDKLQLITYVKTSGNKGLQVYLPLENNKFSYADTRRFTAFIAEYLVKKNTAWFTTERLKKHRGKRLYIDYVQHAEGKTIIAPYSCRGNDQALVATPLDWKEVNENLHPRQFSLDVVRTRLKRKGCPFQSFHESKEVQQFANVLTWLSEHGA